MQQKWIKGFTLLELMIVVAVVGIISAVAYPSYLGVVKKTRRADAQSALVSFSNKMEAYFVENNTFLGAGSDGTPPSTGAPQIFPSEAPIDGATKYYDLTIAAADGATTLATLAPTETSYTLLAIPKYAQAGDGRLRIDSDGNRTWNSKDDGTGINNDW